MCFNRLFQNRRTLRLYHKVVDVLQRQTFESGFSPCRSSFSRWQLNVFVKSYFYLFMTIYYCWYFCCYWTLRDVFFCFLHLHSPDAWWTVQASGVADPTCLFLSLFFKILNVPGIFKWLHVTSGVFCFLWVASCRCRVRQSKNRSMAVLWDQTLVMHDWQRCVVVRAR